MQGTELGEGPRLSVVGIGVSFEGITALQDVSLELGPGEVLGVIGPNGAGKTTLFNVICGFVKPDAGTITWGGTRLTGVRPHSLPGLGVARTLQGVGLFERLSVLENVMLGAEPFRRTGVFGTLLALPRSDSDEAGVRARARAALAQVACGEFEDRLPGTLPYAVQKQVALARALVSEPKLLLLDEPAGGLGAEDLSELARLIDGLRSRMAVMLVDHHMDLVASVCDRLVVLDFGQVIASGAPPVVGRDPRVLEAYLGREATEDEGETVAHGGGEV
jgi:branched-chain amino acid transport system ATP-binding protein